MTFVCASCGRRFLDVPSRGEGESSEPSGSCICGGDLAPAAIPPGLYEVRETPHRRGASAGAAEKAVGHAAPTGGHAAHTGGHAAHTGGTGGHAAHSSADAAPGSSKKRAAEGEAAPADLGYSESHGYGPSHGGPTGPGDAPADIPLPPETNPPDRKHESRAG